MANVKTSFYGLQLSELAQLLGGKGRAREPWELLRRGFDPFVAGSLTEKAWKRLSALCSDVPLSVERRSVSSCGTRKLLLSLPEKDRAVETVLIPGNDRTTVCLSCQVGCGRGCEFCVTATMGLDRSLSSAEIVGQVKIALDEVRRENLPPLRNVVFMGMGEPLDNFEEVRRSVALFTDPHAFKFAPRHITLSTVGTSPPAILALREVPIQIAWSIHAVDDTLRRKLVPSSRHSMLALREAFLELMMGRRSPLFVEMTLLDEINDRDFHAEQLVDFLVPFNGHVRINILPLNPGRSGLHPSSPERGVSFCQILRNQGYFCALRRARGVDQAAACGQLAV